MKDKDNVKRNTFANTKWDQSGWSEDHKTIWQKVLFKQGILWRDNKPPQNAEVAALSAPFFFIRSQPPALDREESPALYLTFVHDERHYSQQQSLRDMTWSDFVKIQATYG